MDARSYLLHIAAECHRQKWKFEDTNIEAFDVLHRIGDDAERRYEETASENRNGDQADEFDCDVCGETMAKDTQWRVDCGRSGCPLMSEKRTGEE